MTVFRNLFAVLALASLPGFVGGCQTSHADADKPAMTGGGTPLPERATTKTPNTSDANPSTPAR